ncbi:YkvA family protein [Bittarella massiliensis (ex Durand et al. 2017)]|uniref:DUF1232 domain-containing protein n=1 Tax=Bittarella massiliensis (ex Durand et al. 2017) TaxID=1720313 RepID=A0AAW5K883_9FIRM|nr:DUF1232 domain-containing protein [Bittarella massiliensis (ex Durand et al. 2017)]MCQ4948798.1 DUF1232 domain-containing protein [Bittarella massiliensis (ex Durand et al. 2017)]
MNAIKARAKQLKTDIPAVFIALKDRETPFLARALAALTVGYALSPIDLIPDFIPVLGYLDDLLLLPALVALTVRCIPADVWARSRERSSNIWQGGKPKRWCCALPVLLFWLLIAWLVVKAVWR